mmetsp:Transcript_36591/g.86780  ORF Transcript_36591/g.86780 Transcript_36591/m.86780 type:complete len:101 (+) Transcript_36591:85-387(+)
MEKQHTKINIDRIVKNIIACSDVSFSEFFLNSLAKYCQLILEEISDECAEICEKESKNLLSETHLFFVLKKKGYGFLIEEIVEEHVRLLTEEREIKNINL